MTRPTASVFLFCSCPPRRPPLIHPPSPAARRRLLGLVRRLIDYGKQLAATLRERPSPPHLSPLPRFGAGDIALILARITRGLLRAEALEARLPRRRPSGRGPRRHVLPPHAAAARPRGHRARRRHSIRARLPTPEQIAAEVRRRPIGAVIADICRDLGITPSHPLWRELQLLIISYGGNLARLVSDMLDQVFPMPATIPARSPTLPRQIPAAACTGPP